MSKDDKDNKAQKALFSNNTEKHSKWGIFK